RRGRGPRRDRRREPRRAIARLQPGVRSLRRDERCGRVRRHRRSATDGLRAFDRGGQLRRPAHERSRARRRGELAMDDQRRAEQLLEERMKSRKPNGATVTEPTDVEPSTDDGQAAGDYKADLQRMAADFANYRKRNEAERTEF